MKIHHVGYLVTDIEQACKDFEKLGYTPVTQCILDVERKVYIIFLEPLQGRGWKVELIAPAADCKLFSKRMLQMGSMPYHICYECDNFQSDIETLQAGGFRLIREPQVAPAIDNRRVVFLYSESIGQVELLENI